MNLEPGVRFAQRYRIERRLGDGAAATVWLALDESLDRQVALKVFHSHAGTSDALLQEARRIAGFNHPHIVTLYDVGTTDGNVYFVMQYIDGEDLKTYLSRFASLTIEKATSLVLQIAQGVAAAHRRGLIHRDLKPGNVLISRDGTVTVTDFGIALMVGEDTVEEEQLVHGTPAYIAPEQARGEAATPVSDVYSIGVLFFEMLAGRPPFEADSPMELVRAHIDTPAPKVTEFNERVPPQLASFIGRLLAKDPNARPNDAGEIVSWLESYIETSEAPTRPIPAQSERADTPATMGAGVSSAEPTDDGVGIWTCLSLGLVGLLALGTLVVGYLWFVRPPQLPSSARGDTTATVTSTTTPVPGTPTEAAQAAATGTTPQNTPSATPPTATASEPTATSTIDAGVRRTAPSVPALPMNADDFLLDGQLSEWNRAGIPLSNLHFGAENWTDETDLSGTGWLAWNPSHLLIAVQVRDDAHVQTQSGWDVFRGDSVELWLDTDLAGDFDTAEGNDDDWQFGFSPGNFQDLPPEGVIYVPVRDSSLNERIEVHARPTSDGYTLEARIPWNAINVDAREGIVLGYALDLSDNDQAGTAQQQTQVASVPNLEWNVPTTFGNLVLR